MNTTPITFTPAAIATGLRQQGVPVAKLDGKRGIRQSGVEVSRVGNRIVFAWQDWENNTDAAAGAAQVIAALGRYGLTATECVTRGVHTGMYRIHRAAA